MVNKVTLIGNLGGDPEIRRLENGAAVASFSLATNENYKDREGNWHDQTEWHNIVLWRWLAERAETQLHKGAMIYLEGKLTTRSWQDAEGNPRKTTEVVGNYYRLLKGRDDQGQRGEGGSNAQSSDRPEPAASTTTSGSPDYSNEPDDDLPF